MKLFLPFLRAVNCNVVTLESSSRDFNKPLHSYYLVLWTVLVYDSHDHHIICLLVCDNVLNMWELNNQHQTVTLAIFSHMPGNSIFADYAQPPDSIIRHGEYYLMAQIGRV